MILSYPYLNKTDSMMYQYNNYWIKKRSTIMTITTN